MTLVKGSSEKNHSQLYEKMPLYCHQHHDFL